jgi:hypothetical protein
VETTIARKPRQSRLLQFASKLGAMLIANLVAAQPLTAPTLVH